MADIEQNLQEIEQERSRLRTAKANLKTAIAEKGVTVADDVKLDQYYTFVNNIQVDGGGVNTSDATVTATDIVVGKIGYGNNGKVYGSRKYVTDGTVYFSQGNLCTTEPVYLDPDTPVEIFSFDAFTDPMYIAEGKPAYVGGGLVHGTMSKLGAGHMIINAGGTLDIPVIGYFEYDSIDMKTIPGIGDLAPENIAYGKTICGITGTHGGSIPGSSGNYTLPDDFRLNLKIAYWKNYEPIHTDLMIFSGDEHISGTSRSWISADYAFFLDYTDGRWTIRYNNTELGEIYQVATNSTLSKHGWQVIDPPIHPVTNQEYEFISLEDQNWTYSG